MPKWPEEFSHIQALVLLNVVSGKTFFERGGESAPRSGESSCQTKRACSRADRLPFLPSYNRSANHSLQSRCLLILIVLSSVSLVGRGGGNSSPSTYFSHIIFIIQENRTADTLFGRLPPLAVVTLWGSAPPRRNSRLLKAYGESGCCRVGSQHLGCCADEACESRASAFCG
jgi:hypothetical protein